MSYQEHEMLRICPWSWYTTVVEHMTHEPKMESSNLTSDGGDTLLGGLYYKHVTIINDDSSFVSKWCLKLIDDPRVVIYDRHRFIIPVTSGLYYKNIK